MAQNSVQSPLEGYTCVAHHIGAGRTTAVMLDTAEDALELEWCPDQCLQMGPTL